MWICMCVPVPSACVSVFWFFSVHIEAHRDQDANDGCAEECFSEIDATRWWISCCPLLYSKCFASSLFLGLYGNDDLHNGLLEVLTAGRKVDNIISMVRNQTHKLENTLSNNIQPQLAELRDIFDGPASNQTALSQLILSLTNVQENVTAATSAAADIRKPLMQVTMTSFLAVNI